MKNNKATTTDCVVSVVIVGVFWLLIYLLTVNDGWAAIGDCLMSVLKGIGQFLLFLLKLMK